MFFKHQIIFEKNKTSTIKKQFNKSKYNIFQLIFFDMSKNQKKILTNFSLNIEEYFLKNHFSRS